MTSNTAKAGGSKVGKFGIGVRVVDDEGDVGVIVGKRKGERQVDYDRYGELWWPKGLLAVAANDNAGQAGELKLEAGKFYRTRDGRKVVVEVNGNGDTMYPWFHDNGCGSFHGLTAEGKSCIDSDEDDLIAEWSDAALEEAPSISPEIVVNDYSGAAEGENSSEWVPKVGDRVRYSGKSPAYSDKFMVGTLGTVREVITSNSIDVDWDVKAIRGMNTGGAKYLANIEPLPVAVQPAAEVEATGITIEAGRYYRTRDGRKVGPILKREYASGSPYQWVGEASNGYRLIFKDDGENYEGRGSVHDLVAEWVEPVDLKAEVESGRMSVNQARAHIGLAPLEPTPPAKFKIGDRVRANGGYSFDPSTSTVVSEGDLVRVRVDGQDDVWNYIANELAPLTTPTFARNDLVTLAAPVKVTGTSGGRVHISFPSGGSFTLPASALIAA